MTDKRESQASGATVFSAAIMTHPSRLDYARSIASRLPGIGVELAVDPDPGARPSTVRTARRAFGASTSEATHHLVLQDDVLMTDGFLRVLEEAVVMRPEAALSLFAEWGSRTAYLARWATSIGVNFVPVFNPYMPMQAIVLPCPLAVDLSAYLETDVSDEEPDDRAVLRFLTKVDAQRLVVVPNLVEHLDFPSLVGNSDQGERRSVCAALSGDFPVFGPDVLPLPKFLPFFAWTSGDAVVIDTANDVPSAHRPSGDALSSWGLSAVDQSEEYESSLDLLDEEPRQVDQRLLKGVWQTAVALGAVQEAAWPGTIERVLGTDKFATESLFTLAPGALRRFVDVSVFMKHKAAVTTWLRAAMRLGAKRCTVPT